MLIPKGNKDVFAIVKCFMPNGIPTIVMQNIKPQTICIKAIIVMQNNSPDIQYIRAVNNPPKISQIRLPRKFISELSYNLGEFRYAAFFIADNDVYL